MSELTNPNSWIPELAIFWRIKKRTSNGPKTNTHNPRRAHSLSKVLGIVSPTNAVFLFISMCLFRSKSDPIVLTGGIGPSVAGVLVAGVLAMCGEVDVCHAC